MERENGENDEMSDLGDVALWALDATKRTKRWQSDNEKLKLQRVAVEAIFDALNHRNIGAFDVPHCQKRIQNCSGNMATLKQIRYSNKVSFDVPLTSSFCTESSSKSNRSMSVQINTNNADLKDLHELRKRRASAAASNRRQSQSESMEDADMKSPGRIGSARLTRRQSEAPTLAAMSSTQSFADGDGVQLRGDKGKARRKSTASTSRGQLSKLPVNNEWKKIFKIHYTPRHQKKLHVELETPTSTLPSIVSSKPQATDGTSSSQSEKLWNLSSKTHHRQEPRKDIRIHYEDYIPKDSWVELKPKRFTRNHKHGNHFEQRRMLTRSHQNRTTPSSTMSRSTNQDAPDSATTHSTNERKDMYVWENPYQIWMMEKTIQIDEMEAC